MNHEHQRLIERLESSAEDFVSSLGKFSDEELHASPTPNDWSIHQLAAHLRDTEEQVFAYRLKRILNEENPAVPNFDQEVWLREHYSASEPLKKILAEFRNIRKKEILLLRKMPAKAWERTATHPEYRTISLEWLMTRNVNHTLDHVAQMGYAFEKVLLKKLNG